MYASPEYFDRQAPTKVFLLHTAVQQAKSLTEVEQCLSNCDVNEQNNAGDTALHVAVASHDELNIVNCLLQHQADPNIQNRQHKTPLDLARELHKEDMRQVLISHGGHTAAQTKQQRGCTLF